MDREDACLFAGDRTLKQEFKQYVKIVKQHAPKRRLPRHTKTSDFCCLTKKICIELRIRRCCDGS